MTAGLVTLKHVCNAGLEAHKHVKNIGAILVCNCPWFHFSCSCLRLTWSALINVRMLRDIAEALDFCAGKSMTLVCRKSTHHVEALVAATKS